jgi:26S proteasome regulatory subunit (ATPase 3-interacting protein)
MMLTKDIGAAQKILIKLHEAKKIEGRISGKQSVYHAIQDLALAPTSEELAQMDALTTQYRDETASLTTQAKTLRTSLARLTSSLSTADLRHQVAAMQEEKSEIEGRLEKLRSATVKPVSVEEKRAVDRELRDVGRCRERRARIVKEMWGFIQEVVPKEEWDSMKEDFGVEI